MIAIDFETSEVGYFDKKSKRTYLGHPRNAVPFMQSLANAGFSEVLDFRKSEKPKAPEATHIYHNAAFDLTVGQNAGLWRTIDILPAAFECTATMARLSDNQRRSGLKDLAIGLLGEKVVQYDDAVKNESAFSEYAKKDAEFTFRLFPILKSELEEKSLVDLYEQVEKPFILVNIECQQNGFSIDLNRLDEKSSSVREQLKLKAILLPAGLNWKSPQQLQSHLYGELGLPVQFLRGKPSTSRKILNKLIESPDVRTILELKSMKATLQQLSQIKTFTDPATRRIHPYINPLGADTGRATSSNPNLQNIEKGSELRELFVASPGHKLIVFDFSQIEPRVLAHFLPDSNFSKLFQSGGDFYQKLSKGFLKTLKGGKESRDIAKLVILATFYGMGEKTLAQNLKISEAEALTILNSFFDSFPEILNFKDTVISKAESDGYVVGLLGRRRYVSDLNSDDLYLKSKAERKAFNAVIQGSAATLFKFKLNQLRSALPRSVRFLNHVHDEVVLEAPESIVDEVYGLCRTILENPVDWFSIPLAVEGGIGQNWKEAKNAK